MARITVFPLLEQPKTDKTIPLYLLITHNATKAKMATGYSIALSQLKKKKIPTNHPVMLEVMIKVVAPLQEKIAKIQDGEDMTARELLQAAKGMIEREKEEIINFFAFCAKYIAQLAKDGRKGSAANMQTTVNALRDYVGRDYLYTAEITAKFIKGFQDYLQHPRRIERMNQGKMTVISRPPVTAVGVNNYIKDFRTMFNACRAQYNDEDSGYMPIPHYPFARVKMLQVASKRGYRAISVVELRRIMALKRNELPPLAELARDMYLLSFLLIGINPIDIYNLKKDEVKDGRVSYCRTKTKTRRADSAYISVAVPEQAQEIADRYRSGKGYECYFRFKEVQYSDCKHLIRAVNEGLQTIKELCGIEVDKFTWYSARHTWATIACNDCGYSDGDVARALNHSSTAHRVTATYIKDDWGVIDRMNERVISYVFEK